MPKSGRGGVGAPQGADRLDNCLIAFQLSLDPIRPFAPSIREGNNLSLRPSWPVLQFFDKIDHHVQGLPQMESISIVDRKYVPSLLKMIFHKNVRSIHLFLR